MKFYTVTLFLFFSSLTWAQFTKPNAQITNKPNGAILCELIDSTKIAIGNQESGWYPVTTTAFVPKKAVTGDSTLLPDTELVNKNKDVIGKVLAECKVQLVQAEGRGFYKYYKVLVSGYIKGTKFHYKSIPEKGIEDILEDGKMAGRQEKFARYFKRLGFISEEHGNYTVWAYLDEVGTLEQPAYRTLVIFRGETSLYCIVSKSTFMSLEKLKDERDHSTGKYYFYQRPSDRNWEEIKDIVYGFIPL